KPTTKSTTTVAPKPTTKSTTTAAPTTAPPSPTPPVGDYNLTIGDKTCLRAKVALQIRLANKTFTIQPNQTHLNGSCDETRVALYFNFSQGFINFNFTRDVGNKTVYVDAVGFTLNYPLTRGHARYSGSNTSLHLFPAKIGHSYSCKSDSLYMGKGLYLDITNDQMQAFNLTKNDFGSPDFCPADQPDYRVAIAVGVVLLVLIIVVVVAYLLSRRKRMEGYQSL
uniref:Lysosome-associated membrane glycoprotein 2-like luminal domain-containing protein n=1 Tax=Amphilophus citrinellus TaxID=61819 RepID=A0A3Q0SEJ8_AMPCI